MSINYKKTTIEKDKIVLIKYNQYYRLVKAQELDDGDVIPFNQRMDGLLDSKLYWYPNIYRYIPSFVGLLCVISIYIDCSVQTSSVQTYNSNILQG